MENNKISVIMGIYNCADTLPEAIDSILAQTYTDWELIMCDDCSSDGTCDVAMAYAERFPEKIILLRNEVNSKLAFSLNRCLEHASGEFVARMDGDDISAPERFVKQLSYLREHPDIDLVGTAMQRFSDKGMADIDIKQADPDRFTLHRSIPFNHATIMTYKRVYDALGGYTVAERTNRGQDYDLWFRFYHAGFSGGNIQEPLYLVREDMDAIKRRSFKVRWNAFKTTRYGYKLLGYPKWWIIRPAALMVFKSLVPYRMVAMYRGLQKKIFEKGNR